MFNTAYLSPVLSTISQRKFVPSMETPKSNFRLWLLRIENPGADHNILNSESSWKHHWPIHCFPSDKCWQKYQWPESTVI